MGQSDTPVVRDECIVRAWSWLNVGRAVWDELPHLQSLAVSCKRYLTKAFHSAYFSSRDPNKISVDNDSSNRWYKSMCHRGKLWAEPGCSRRFLFISHLFMQALADAFALTCSFFHLRRRSHFIPRIWNVGMGPSSQNSLPIAWWRNRDLLPQSIPSKFPSSTSHLPNIILESQPKKATSLWAKANSNPTRPSTPFPLPSAPNPTLGISTEPPDRPPTSFLQTSVRSASSRRSPRASRLISPSSTKSLCRRRGNSAFTPPRATARRPSSRCAGKIPGTHCIGNSWRTCSRWTSESTPTGQSLSFASSSC